MATLTIQNVSDELLAELRREAESQGTTPESIAADRLHAGFERGHEHVDQNKRLLERLRGGESIEGKLGDELRAARGETGVWLTREHVCAALSESRS